MRLNAKSSNTVSSITIYNTDLPTSFGGKPKSCHAMIHTIAKSSNCEFNSSTLTRNARKDTPNRHKATSYISLFSQSTDIT